MTKLDDAKQAAQFALESLIRQCNRELSNLERFDDERMILATADIQSSVDNVMERADELESAYENRLTKYRTEDGYTFYLQPDGSLTDDQNPELADQVFDNLEALRSEVNVTEVSE